MNDSIIHITDTIAKIRTDSLLLQDSIPAVDSIAEAPSPTGFEGLPLPSAASTEPWVFVTSLILFLLLSFVLLQSGRVLWENVKTLFSPNSASRLSPTYTGSVFKFQLLITVFTTGVLPLALYRLVFAQHDVFPFSEYLLLIGIFIGFIITKHILFEIVGNTFFDTRFTRQYKRVYFGLLDSLAVFLFPVLILHIYQPESWQFALGMAALTGIALIYIILIIKLFQIFYTKLLALFYIFLYLCTLEILPIFILFRVCEKFI